MAYQMIYTSIRSGLVAGRSGFCTAARHRKIKESLVARLEDFSAQYDRSLGDGSPPVIYSYRIVTIRENRYHVLMRIGDAGTDYSGRTNHIAHAVILSSEEVASLRITPAEAILELMRLGVWKTRYEESAQYFGPEHQIDFSQFPLASSLPAAHWQTQTSSAANAARFYGASGPVEAGVEVSCADDVEAIRLLELIAESLLLLDPRRKDPTTLWSIPFTSLLQSAAESRQFTWCGCLSGSALQAREQSSGRMILRLGSDMVAPVGKWATIAETGEAHRDEVRIESVSASNPEAVSSEESADSYTTEYASEATAAYASGGRDGLPLTTTIEIPLPPASLHPPSSLKGTGRIRAERRRRPLPLLLGGALAFLFLITGAYWYFTKDVRDAKKKVEELVESSSWANINRHFADGKIKSNVIEESPYLKDAKNAAVAITRYDELAKNPGNWNSVVRGKASASDVFETIGEEIGKDVSSNEFHTEIVAHREQAEKAVTSLREVEESLVGLSKNLRTRLENNAKQETFEEPDDVQKVTQSIGKLKDVSPGSEKEYEEQNNRINSVIIPTIRKLVETPREFETAEDLEKAKAEFTNYFSSKKKDLDSFSTMASRNWGNELKSELSKLSELVTGRLAAQSGSLVQKPMKPTERQEVTVSTSAPDSREKKASPPSQPNPTLLLFPMPEDSRFDLSVIDGIQDHLKNFKILPFNENDRTIEPHRLKESVSGTIVLEEGRKRLFYVKGLALELSPGDEAARKVWALFQKGFRFELGSSEEPKTWYHVVYSPIDQDDPGSFLDVRSLKDVILAENGGFQLSVKEQNFLSAIKFPTLPETNWLITFSSGQETKEFPLADLNGKVNLGSDLEKILVKLRAELTQAQKLKETPEEIKLIEFLHKELFPKREYLESVEVPLAEPFVIGERKLKKNVPPLKSLKDYSKGSVNEVSMIKTYVLSYLLDVLDKSASGADPYNPAAGLIEKFKGESKESSAPSEGSWFEKCAELAKDLEEGGYVRLSPEIPTSSFTKKEEAEVALSKYAAEVYGTEFFRGWTEVFTPGNVKIYTEFYSRDQRINSRPIELIQADITRVETQIKAFSPDTFLKSGEVRIYRHYTEANPNSPDQMPHKIPVLLGKQNPGDAPAPAPAQ